MAINWVKWAVIVAGLVGIPGFIGVIQNWNQIKQGSKAFYQDVFHRKVFTTINRSNTEICVLEVLTSQSDNTTNLLVGQSSLKSGESRDFNLPFGTYQFTARDCNQSIVYQQSNQSLVQDDSNPKWEINSTWFTLPVGNKTNSQICYLWFKLTSSSEADWKNYLSQPLDPNPPNPFIINLPSGTYDIAVGDCQAQPSTIQLLENRAIAPGKFSQWDITPTPAATTPILLAPEQVVWNYYNFLNNQQYNQAWSLLSEADKQNKYPNGITQYTERWQGATNFSVSTINVSYPTQNTAQITAHVEYNQFRTGVCQHLVHQLILDATESNWLIENVTFDRACQF